MIEIQNGERLYAECHHFILVQSSSKIEHVDFLLFREVKLKNNIEISAGFCFVLSSLVQSITIQAFRSTNS